MSHPFDEPLTPQERAMADRLARLGPHDGPSPALDARILAAAHAAVAPRKRQRWLALTGIPATLVTGAGMAAVLALAVGLVWQLRPSAPAPQAPRGEGDDFGYVTAEVVKRSDTATAGASASAAPPPPPAAEAPALARAVQVPPAMARREAGPAGGGAIAAKQPAARESDHFLDEAVDPAHTHPAQVASAPAGRSDAEPQGYSYSAPAPAAPAAAAPAAAAAAAAMAAETGQRQRAEVQESVAAQRKAAANAAAKQADARELRSQAASVAAPAPAPVAAAEADVAADAADAAESGTTLDRIEVTGSRMVAGGQSVRSDRDLAPDQWLQRIRERRDGGDLDGARQSLELFRKTHPRLRLPDDLRTLAAPTR